MNPIEQFLVYSYWLAQGLVIAATIYVIAYLISLQQRKRWSHLLLANWKAATAPAWLLSILYIQLERKAYLDRAQYWKSSGILLEVSWYFVLKRLVTIGCIAIILWGLVREQVNLPWLIPISPLYACTIMIVIVVILQSDRMWLRSLGHLRALQITKEIYIVSNHLYYLAESQLHIHTKLTRCLPFTQLIKPELERLLADWYYHPGQALQQFKLRLATDDAMSFVETIDALRLHESSHYYQLLKQRINDYKDKLELAKEGRKETTSYVLFVIAGIPILYTFQVFIYPWVQEGQKLFMNIQ